MNEAGIFGDVNQIIVNGHRGDRSTNIRIFPDNFSILCIDAAQATNTVTVLGILARSQRNFFLV